MYKVLCDVHCMYIVRAVNASALIVTTVQFYDVAYLFQPVTKGVQCRTSCEDIAPENIITWCVNIASFENDVETCISLDNTHKVITNSSCEAEVAQLPDYLSLPTVSSTASNVYWYDSFPLNFRTVMLVLVVLDVWGSLTWTGSLRVRI